jgi:hypothetical protein
VHATSKEYTPRHLEKNLIYRIIAEQLDTLFARQRAGERTVPGFVEEEFRSFLRCGIKEFGFLRLRCKQKESVVAGAVVVGALGTLPPMTG